MMQQQEAHRLWERVHEGLQTITAVSTAPDCNLFCYSLDGFSDIAELCGVIGGVLSDVSPCFSEVKYRQIALDYNRLVHRLRTLSPHHHEMNALIEDDTEFVYAESILLEVADHLVVMDQERREALKAAPRADDKDATDENAQADDTTKRNVNREGAGKEIEAEVNETPLDEDATTEATPVVADGDPDNKITNNSGGVSVVAGKENRVYAEENGAPVEEDAEDEDDAKRQENMTTKEKLIDSYTRHRISGAIYDIMDKLIDCEEDGMLDLIYTGTGGHRFKLMQFMQYLCKLLLSGLTALCAAEALLKNDRQAAEKMGKSFSDLFEQLKDELQKQLMRSTNWEVLRANLKVDLERLSTENRGRPHKEVASRIYEGVREKYDWLNFFICVYDDIGGPENHSFNGHWVHVCHRNNMNVVAAYAAKGNYDRLAYLERRENIDIWLTALNEEINSKAKTKATSELVTAKDAKDAIQEYLNEEGGWRFVLCTRRKKGLWASGDLWDRAVWHMGKNFSFCIILK
ncbi:uncharacterized protein LOC135483638 [Lineus longissimus]|uniref:uncharacterized protein LOC135483638 n=1 Tax=Lineus longissimus TaxID=88925 RepID=UPI002B4DECC1